ncbi:MAG: Smr/MutS family protein [Acidobacteria bacterium]|nr:Smr/MutS family protein [Acidobacteriota bacterium]
MAEDEDLEFLQAMAQMGLRKSAKKARPKSEPEAETGPDPEFLQAIQSIEVVPNKDAPDRQPDLPTRKIKVSKKESVEEVLDLHGLTKEEALVQLTQFCVQNFISASPSGLVITGKGLHSQGGSPILKPAVEQWILTQGKRYVKAYAEAPRAFGGRGALVLYFRNS